MRELRNKSNPGTLVPWETQAQAISESFLRVVGAFSPFPLTLLLLRFSHQNHREGRSNTRGEPQTNRARSLKSPNQNAKTQRGGDFDFERSQRDAGRWARRQVWFAAWWSFSQRRNGSASCSTSPF